MEKITVETVDKSEWIDISFYDLLWYWGTPHADENPTKLGWYQVDSALCYWIVKSKARLFTTVMHVTADKLASDAEVEQKIASYTRR